MRLTIQRHTSRPKPWVLKFLTVREERGRKTEGVSGALQGDAGREGRGEEEAAGKSCEWGLAVGRLTFGDHLVEELL